MKIKEAMTNQVKTLTADSSLHEAAKYLLELDCGFLPVSDEDKNKLVGVLTDRDITIRAVAEGLAPDKTLTGDIMSKDVWYCFSDDDLGVAAASMRSQGVYRLIVLDNRDDKNLCGIISLGDIYRHNEKQEASSTAESILRSAA